MRPVSRAEIEAQPVNSVRLSSAVIASCLGGAFNLYLDPEDTSLTPSISKYGYWEAWITSWHTKNFEEGMVYLDIGANVGYYSLLAAHLGANKVYGFEPNERTMEFYRRSVAERYETHMYSRIYPVGLALGTQNEFRRLNLHGDNLGGVSLGETYDPTEDEQKWGIKEEGVTGVITLDDFLGRQSSNRKHLWKIDVEGHEEEVLRGATKSMQDYKPTLLLEWTPGAYSDAFFGDLTAYGDVRLVNYDGDEWPVTEAYLESSIDWQTVAVHPYV